MLQVYAHVFAAVTLAFFHAVGFVPPPFVMLIVLTPWTLITWCTATELRHVPSVTLIVFAVITYVMWWLHLQNGLAEVVDLRYKLNVGTTVLAATLLAVREFDHVVASAKTRVCPVEAV